MAISMFYQRFDQTPDEEVVRLLAAARKERAAEASRK